jgi:hypothetical protein
VVVVVPVIISAIEVRPQVKPAAPPDRSGHGAPDRSDALSSCSWRSWPSVGRGRLSAKLRAGYPW